MVFKSLNNAPFVKIFFFGLTPLFIIEVAKRRLIPQFFLTKQLLGVRWPNRACLITRNETRNYEDL